MCAWWLPVKRERQLRASVGHAPPRALAVLGSTGSIGRRTLEVVESLPGRFSIAALAAGGNIALLAEQVAAHRPQLVAVRSPAAVDDLAERLRAHGVTPLPQIGAGGDGLRAAAASADMLVAAVVGVAALEAIEAALRRGCDVALANKEALVAAGRVLLRAAAAGGAAILPIDSEHSAVHQCLRAGETGEMARIILTASGGPFLRLPPSRFDAVTPADALRHPTWKMGDRITIDSATLMNKGFEIIEACHLFGVDERRVEVVIHPQSIVHSLVEFRDGSVMAQLGTADMRTPIQYALTWPLRLESARLRLKLEEVGRLDFESADVGRFPCLRLAREAARTGGGAPAVLNAADEVAVERFCAGALSFPDIARVVEETLQRLPAGSAETLAEVLATDRRARQVAAELADGKTVQAKR